MPDHGMRLPFCNSLSVSQLFLLVLLVCFQYNTITFSNMPLECNFDYGTEPYLMDDAFMICLNYIPLMVKENLFLSVGKTMLIHQKYIWKLFQNIKTDLIFQIANNNIYSSVRPYSRPGKKNNDGMTFPILPLLITMDLGKVIDISLQDLTSCCPNEKIETNILKDLYLTCKIYFKIKFNF